MISVHADPTDPFDWLIGLAMMTLAGLSFWLAGRNQTLSGRRKTIRLLLNGLLWLLLVAYALQPTWQMSARSGHTLLVAPNVPRAFWRSVADSLGVKSVHTASNFVASQVDSVTLVGQAFSPELLSRLSRQAVRWVPYDEPDQLRAIQWRGVLRQGDRQEVSGQLVSSQKQRISLAYAGRLLDSLDVPAGRATFHLRFPAFALGRTAVTLLLNRQPMDTIRFFTYPARPLTYQFLLDTPDFESKTLADWLGRQGNAVVIDATISRQLTNRLTINKAATRPDILITDPGNATDPLVRRMVSEGRSVLFINLSNPTADCAAINRALGGRWQVRKISNEPTVPVADGLTALPYVFVPQNRQLDVPGYPVAFQPLGGRVGVSVLSETFPLKLSGDSTAYDRVWYSLLAPLRPPPAPGIALEAPIFRRLRQPVEIDGIAMTPKTLLVGTDTVGLSPSPLNGQVASGLATFDESGWQPVQDSLAVYVEADGFSAIRQRRLVGAYVAAHSANQVAGRSEPRRQTARVPDWGWLLAFVLCLTGLWLEPKLTF